MLGSDETKEDAITMLTEAQTYARGFTGFLDHADALAECLSITRIDKGETIMQQGEQGTWVGILLRGNLDIIVHGRCVFTVEPGNFVGEMILWTGGVRQGTVVAATPGVLATILVSARLLVVRSPPVPPVAE